MSFMIDKFINLLHETVSFSDKPTFSHLVKKFYSLFILEEPTTWPYPEPYQSCPNHPMLFLEDPF